ncbi:MAG TPA: hypothetical protein VKA32_06125 [Gammaproteobacteria bacterium]|nr:hypothetical protein [Gammaproteobacteria bacterium]
MNEFMIVTDDTEARIFTRQDDSGALLEVEHVRAPRRRDPPEQFAEELARYIRALVDDDEAGQTAPAFVLGPQRFVSALRSRVEDGPEPPFVTYLPWDHGTSSVAEIADGLVRHGELSLPRGLQLPRRRNRVSTQRVQRAAD